MKKLFYKNLSYNCAPQDVSISEGCDSVRGNAPLKAAVCDANAKRKTAARFQRLFLYMLFCAAAFFCMVSASAEDSISGGRMERFSYTSSTYNLPGTRDVYVYLPAVYDVLSDEQFPVLYMFDGQNIWDKKSLPWEGWKVETSMERLAAKKKIRPCIIVGISNSMNRTMEYVGWCDSLPLGGSFENPSLAKEYARQHRLMIVEEIIPLVESRWRALPDRSARVVAGSSFGAFLAARFAQLHSDIFCGAGLFSGGSTGFEQIIAENGFDFDGNHPVRFYIDCGTGDYLERALLPGCQALKEYLLEKGYKQAKSVKKKNGDFFYQECKGEPHNEKAWSSRVPAFLEWIFRVEK